MRLWYFINIFYFGKMLKDMSKTKNSYFFTYLAKKFLKRLKILAKMAKKTLDVKAKEICKDSDFKNTGIIILSPIL